MNIPNKENIRKVVAALRSGEYLQGFGALEYVNAVDGKVHNCCLGVATREFMKENPDILNVHELDEPVEHEKVVSANKICFDWDAEWGRNREEADTLPDPVAKWLGIDIDPTIEVEESGHLSATHANDVKNYNFDMIADALENRYLNDSK